MAQQHGQPAGREVETVSSVGEDGGQLRVESLRHAVADRAPGDGHEAERASRVDHLDGAVEDVQARRLIAQGEVAVHERVGDGFADRAAMIVRARDQHLARVATRSHRARARIPQVAVATDEALGCFAERVQIARELRAFDLRRLGRVAGITDGGDA